MRSLTDSAAEEGLKDDCGSLSEEDEVLRLSVNASFRQVDDLIKTQRRPRLGCEYIRAVGRQAVVTVMPMDGHYLGRGHSSHAIAPFIMLQNSHSLSLILRTLFFAISHFHLPLATTLCF